MFYPFTGGFIKNLIDIFEEPNNEELIIKWKENGTEYSLAKGMFGDVQRII